MNILARWKTPSFNLAVAGIAAYCFATLPTVDNDKLYSAAGVIAGVCATLLGFLVTAVAIITALVDKALILNMRKTGHYRVLMSDTFLTCAILLFTLAISAIALVTTAGALKWVVTAISFSLTLSLLYAYESGRRFALIVTSI